jgi:hypothetical protein
MSWPLLGAHERCGGPRFHRERGDRLYRERGTSSPYRFAASALISSRSDVTGRYDDGMFSDGSNALEDTNK